MINLLILMAWTLALTVLAVWFYARLMHKAAESATKNYVPTEDQVVEYMAELTPDELGVLADKVYDARSGKS